MEIQGRIEISIGWNYSNFSTGNKINSTNETAAFNAAFCCVKKNQKLFLFIKSDSKGTLYKISDNVQRVRTGLVKDGKLTLRFKKPRHDVMISQASPHKLKVFLLVTGLPGVLRGSRPNTLHVLFFNILTIEQKVLEVSNLQVLNLTCNNIQEIPVAFAALKLKHLDLTYNELVEFPKQLVVGVLGQTLEYLDLSYNNVLPYGLHQMRLEALDIFPNFFNTVVYHSGVSLLSEPSLMGMAASILLENDLLPYSENVNTKVMDFIADHGLCICGKRSFQNVSTAHLLMRATQLAATVDFKTGVGPYRVLVEIYFCSYKCSKIVAAKLNM
ncbi:leucine-rich repeat protein 1 [Caerostris darwini]|uniref:Leucine-rich repeat protein 1 n=1 Tax=Caerostris darwini TaxID=1538125 RepID=A0AAV4MLC0_9ARAC|nr:leucine-rich repeat protein 1 [Caerostris darwini]